VDASSTRHRCIVLDDVHVPRDAGFGRPIHGAVIGLTSGWEFAKVSRSKQKGVSLLNHVKPQKDEETW